MSEAPDRHSSMRALRIELESAIAVPLNYAGKPLASALRSQGQLAKHSDPDLGISACALNTFKRACADFPGGYRAFDALRLEALARLEAARKNATPKTTKAALQSKAQSLSGELAILEGDLLLLTKMLELALRQARSYALDGKNKAIIELCRREQNAIRDMMTLRRTHKGRLTLVNKPDAQEAQ